MDDLPYGTDDVVSHLNSTLEPERPKRGGGMVAKRRARDAVYSRAVKVDQAAMANYDALPRPLKPPTVSQSSDGDNSQ